MTTVYMRHVRGASLCARGLRTWFERHSLDYVNFLKHGIDANVFRATGDPLALRVVEAAEKEASNGIT